MLNSIETAGEPREGTVCFDERVGDYRFTVWESGSRYFLTDARCIGEDDVEIWSYEYRTLDEAVREAGYQMAQAHEDLDSEELDRAYEEMVSGEWKQ